jgi:hypothetical protein
VLNRIRRFRSRNLALLFAAALAFPMLSAFRLRAADDPKPEATQAQLAKDLVGAWILAGTPDKPEDPPKTGGRIKFFTGKNWCITQADPETGKVIYHHGGTYTLDGDGLAETVEYANENTATLIKETLKFKIKVEGDTYTQIGQGNNFNEVWKRLK